MVLEYRMMASSKLPRSNNLDIGSVFSDDCRVSTRMCIGTDAKTIHRSLVRYMYIDRSLSRYIDTFPEENGQYPPNVRMMYVMLQQLAVPHARHGTAHPAKQRTTRMISPRSLARRWHGARHAHFSFSFPVVAPRAFFVEFTICFVLEYFCGLICSFSRKLYCSQPCYLHSASTSCFIYKYIQNTDHTYHTSNTRYLPKMPHPSHHSSY